MAMVKTVKVSDKGQIAIPTEIRDAIGITKGDDLILLEAGGKILIEKADRITEKVKEDFRDIVKFNELALKKVWSNKKDDIWKKYLEK